MDINSELVRDVQLHAQRINWRLHHYLLRRRNELKRANRDPRMHKVFDSAASLVQYLGKSYISILVGAYKGLHLAAHSSIHSHSD